VSSLVRAPEREASGRLMGHRSGNNPLVVVSRICYSGCMILYRFVSSRYETVRAFTRNATGDNLPADYAPWRAMDGEDGMSSDAVTPCVVEIVRKTGYFLLSGCSVYSRKADW
jgi:hypothetical protein